MTLQDYLAKNHLRPSAFAALAECAPSTITRILNGEREPGLKLMRRIREITDGEVTADDFLGPLEAAE